MLTNEKIIEELNKTFPGHVFEIIPSVVIDDEKSKTSLQIDNTIICACSYMGTVYNETLQNEADSLLLNLYKNEVYRYLEIKKLKQFFDLQYGEDYNDCQLTDLICNRDNPIKYAQVLNNIKNLMTVEFITSNDIIKKWLKDDGQKLCLTKTVSQIENIIMQNLNIKVKVTINDTDGYEIKPYQKVIIEESK